MRFFWISSEILHITTARTSTIASAMMRFQEYYESVHPDIYRQVHTREQILAHDPNYVHNWSGFNVPGFVFDPFLYGHKFKGITPKEQHILDVVNERDLSKLYVIGTKNDVDLDTLTHELVHAAWYLNPEYAKIVSSIIGELPRTTEALLKMGYNQSVVLDEINAYAVANWDKLPDRLSMLKEELGAYKQAHLSYLYEKWGS